jgi:hypothetical protein
MLNATVALHDVEDVEGFVQATINKGRLRLTPEQRDELAAEGLRIMCKLSNDYEPGKNGLDASASKFSGYAAKFLPGKLSDAWHRLQGHRLASGPDGVRRWQYDDAPTSLSVIAEKPGGLDTVKSLQHREEYEPEVLDTLSQVLANWWERRCDLVTQYFEMRSEGYSTRDFQIQARLLPQQAKVIESFAKELYRDLRRETQPLKAA